MVTGIGSGVYTLTGYAEFRMEYLYCGGISGIAIIIDGIPWWCYTYSVDYEGTFVEFEPLTDNNYLKRIKFKQVPTMGIRIRNVRKAKDKYGFPMSGIEIYNYRTRKQIMRVLLSYLGEYTNCDIDFKYKVENI